MSLIKSLEELDREHAAKRARLEKDHALAAALPTEGVIVEWIGENGWDKEGKPLPPVNKSVPLFPHIIHGPCVYKQAEHVAFTAPDGGSADPHSEHVSSQYRADFVKKYLRTLLDTCAPIMLETVAVRCNESARNRYAGYFVDGFDYETKADSSYADSRETARGLFVLDIGHHTGQHGYMTAELEFYISKPQPTKVSFKLDRDGLLPWKLAPRPRMTSDNANAGVASWSFAPNSDVGAVEMFKRASADRYGGSVPYGYDVEYLIPDRATLNKILGL